MRAHWMRKFPKMGQGWSTRCRCVNASIARSTEQASFKIREIMKGIFTIKTKGKFSPFIPKRFLKMSRTCIDWRIGHPKACKDAGCATMCKKLRIKSTSSSQLIKPMRVAKMNAHRIKHVTAGCGFSLFASSSGSFNLKFKL